MYGHMFNTLDSARNSKIKCNLLIIQYSLVISKSGRRLTQKQIMFKIHRIISKPITEFCNKNQLQIINDNSFNQSYNFYHKQNKLALIFNQKEYDEKEEMQMKEIINQKPYCVINPDEPKRVVWDIISMLFIFIQMITIPLIVSFELEVEGGFKIFNDIMDYFFMADVLVSFNTGFYRKGSLITKRLSIFVHYVKFWFWVDVISSFPYDDVISSFQEGSSESELQRNAQLLKFVRFLKFIKVVRLLRALKLKKILGKLQENLSFAVLLTNFIAFFKLCFLILFLAHWCACIWHILVVWSADQDETWLHYYGMRESHWSDRYISSLYFSITTMVTIGYGDVHAQNRNEQIYSIFAMILASGVFGYAMNNVMVLFQVKSEEEQEMQKKHSIILQYMKQKDINGGLHARVKNYLEWLSDSEQLARNSHYQIIQNLSHNLKNEVISLIQGRVLRNIHVLHHFSPTLTTKLAFQIQEQSIPISSLLPPVYVPEESVFHLHHLDTNLDNRALYFVKSGQVQILLGQSKLALKKKNDYFGEIGFFSNNPRTATVKSEDFANLLIIKRSNFEHLVRQNQNDLEAYHHIKHQLDMNHNISLLNIKCFCCHHIDHPAKYCPKAHYQINLFDKIKVIKQNETQLNELIMKKRCKKKKVNSRRLLSDSKFVIQTQRIAMKADVLTSYLESIRMMITEAYDQGELSVVSLKQQKDSTKIKKGFTLRESFDIEQIKTFREFLPRSNIGAITERHNKRVMTFVEKMEEERKSKMMESQKALVNSIVLLQSSYKKMAIQDEVVGDLERRKRLVNLKKKTYFYLRPAEERVNAEGSAQRVRQLERRKRNQEQKRGRGRGRSRSAGRVGHCSVTPFIEHRAIVFAHLAQLIQRDPLFR